jgi:hypothetical protein
MGFYTQFTDPLARAELVRYYRFLERYDSLYHANRSHAEALLLYPRSRVHAGDLTAVERFRRLGRRLLDEHVLFDVLPDDLGARAQRGRGAYAVVVNPADAGRDDDAWLARLPEKRSRFTAPGTVRVSASEPAAGGEFDLHFVNYNRQEPAEKRAAGHGIQDEKPIAAPKFSAEFVLPRRARVRQLELITPERTDPVRTEFTQSGRQVRFTVPEFLVYAVARVRTELE